MSLTKEVHRLMKTARKRTDGQVAVESFESARDDADIQVVTVAVEPNAGLYKGGRFIFLIQVPENYPHDGQPSVWCESEVYHPNIDTTECRCDALATNVCLNIFDHGTWNNTFGLEAIVHGLLFLMHNPNFEDPLSPFFDVCNVEQEMDNVRGYMAGEDIDGKSFNLELAGKSMQDKDEIKPSEKATQEVEGQIKPSEKATQEVEGQIKPSEKATQEVEGQIKPSEKATQEVEGQTKATDEGQDLDRGDIVAATEGDENEDAENTGGFRLLAMDGELVLIAEDHFEKADELDKTHTDEDNHGENEDGAANNIDPTTVAEETVAKVDENTDLIAHVERTEVSETNNDVTTMVHDNQTTSDHVQDVDKGDCQNGNELLIETTKHERDIVGRNMEEWPDISNLNGPVTGSGSWQYKCSPGNEHVTDKVVKKILANLQYIGGKILGCFNNRFM